jgi:hypothetical protein
LKVIEIEIARANISAEDLNKLVSYYGNVNNILLTELTTLADSVHSHPWPMEYESIIPAGLIDLITLENSASTFKSFEPILVPGLLQTEEYARSAITQCLPDLSSEQIDSLAQLRISRQDLLTRENSPQFRFILDEAVIQRLAAGGSTMRSQLHRLADLSTESNITIEIVPFRAGLYKGLRRPFVLLEVEKPVYYDVLYVENEDGHGSVVRNTSDRVIYYHQILESIAEIALSPEESITYIQGV